jgi:hypothetical protein
MMGLLLSECAQKRAEPSRKLTGLFQVDNRTIYKVHRSIFQELSPVMDSIFSIPNGKAVGDSTRKGEEMYPLYIPGTAVVEFDDFLQWLYRV